MTGKERPEEVSTFSKGKASTVMEIQRHLKKKRDDI